MQVSFLRLQASPRRENERIDVISSPVKSQNAPLILCHYSLSLITDCTQIDDFYKYIKRRRFHWICIVFILKKAFLAAIIFEVIADFQNILASFRLKIYMTVRNKYKIITNCWLLYHEECKDFSSAFLGYRPVQCDGKPPFSSAASS